MLTNRRPTVRELRGMKPVYFKHSTFHTKYTLRHTPNFFIFGPTAVWLASHNQLQGSPFSFASLGFPKFAFSHRKEFNPN